MATHFERRIYGAFCLSLNILSVSRSIRLMVSRQVRISPPLPRQLELLTYAYTRNASNTLTRLR